ncbi:MAG: RluA family pseudouridine synthase [Tissierellia bacterium]|nr:RluA family pseudouridine synthase [Tissierellia bacterium]
MKIRIIYEDSDLIVIEKPPGVPSQQDPSGDPDVTALLNMDYIGVVHRLDRPVGGVMVYAKTKQANSFLSKGVSSGGFHKKYLAIVSGKPEEIIGELKNYLKKDAGKSFSSVVDKNTSGSKHAILEYKLLDSVSLDTGEILSLLKIVLKTGRHHQIRVQLANYGIPIWGDTKYNQLFSNTKVWTQIALWAYSLEFRHPSGKKKSFFSYPESEYPWTLFIDTIEKLKSE